MLKILFTNAGRRTYLIQFALDLEYAGYPIQTFVSDCSFYNAALHVAPPSRIRLLPPVLQDINIYEHALLELVEQEKINVLFPLSDLDLQMLANTKEKFHDLGCQVIISSVETIKNCNNKQSTFEFCVKNGLPTPESWFDKSTFNGFYPVLQKPILGSGSGGLKKIICAEDMNDFQIGKDMLQQWIDGDEFGLDILNDLDGELISVCIKQKILMRAGETDKAKIIMDDELLTLGKEISSKFRHVGNLDCDVLRDKNGALFCIDFNPRFGGGYPATHMAGFNYLKGILDMIRGLQIDIPRKPKAITVMKGISLYWTENQ